MWQLVQANAGHDAGRTAPAARCKHAVCFASDGHIYLFGGKSKHSPLKDLWRFDSEQNYWEEIKCQGECPPCLQNHSMNAWNDKLYVFGGEVGYDSNDTPLWTLDLNTCRWNKWQCVHVQSPGITGQQPNGRNGHSSVLLDNKLCIFGGYQSLNGTLNDLWTFDLTTEKWLCLSGSGNSVQPASRYLHSAIVYRKCMYIYGGMSNLQPKSDFWKWDFEKSQWSKIKCGKGPGELSGHSAIRVHNHMYVFGGERVGHFSNELWKFNLINETWTKIQSEGVMPNIHGPYVAIANPLFELLEIHEQQLCNETMDNEFVHGSKVLDIETHIIPKESLVKNNKNSKKDKCKTNNKSNNKESNKESKCTCKCKSNNVFRRLFRKRLIRSKFSASFISSPCDFCQKSKTNGNECNAMPCKSPVKCLDCDTLQTLCGKCLQTSQVTLKPTSSEKSQKSHKSPKSQTPDERIMAGKYEIGQIDDDCDANQDLDVHMSESQDANGRTSNNSSIDTSEEDELIMRLSVLEKQLAADTLSPNGNVANVSPSTLVVRSDIKKPRPKSELIAELISVEEDINDSWDGIDLKRHSVHESMSYYSLCFPSPSYTPTDQSIKPTYRNNALVPTSFNQVNGTLTSATVNSTTLRCNGSTARTIRPKSYQPDSRIFDYYQNNPASNVNALVRRANVTNQKSSPSSSANRYDSQVSNAVHHDDNQNNQNNNCNDINGTNNLSNSNGSNGINSVNNINGVNGVNGINGINGNNVNNGNNANNATNVNVNHGNKDVKTCIAMDTIYSPTSASVSLAMEGISHSMSQSSGYQSLSDECELSSPALPNANVSANQFATSGVNSNPEVKRNECQSIVNRKPFVRQSNQTFDVNSFTLPMDSSVTSDWPSDSLEQLESTSSICSSNTTNNCTSLTSSYMSNNSNCLPNSISGGLELTLDACAQQRIQRYRQLPRAISLDKKLSTARTNHIGTNPLWSRFHSIKEVIAPSSPALRKNNHGKFHRRRFIRSMYSHQDELQLAMYVFGSANTSNQCQPLCVWKLYV